jgi:hypothetical protein
VLGDGNTVFGAMESELLDLPPEYRSHGGLTEAKVPLVVHNAAHAPGAAFFQSNVDLARWLFAPAGKRSGDM